MKVKQTMRIMREEPSVDPYYEMHVDITFMTEREFMNVLDALDVAFKKFNVVLDPVLR